MKKEKLMNTLYPYIMHAVPDALCFPARYTAYYLQTVIFIL